MHNITYIGKAEYCYSNSAAMLLNSIDEQISPSKIEVPAGIGLSSFLTKEGDLLFISPLAVAPDVGLSTSLHILGFDFIEKGFSSPDDFPIKELKTALKISPVVIGPLDMGYLVYQPGHKRSHGADHYVFVYEADKENVYLHDPYGYPHAFLTYEQLKLAWQADAINYKQDYYHYWTNPTRKHTPSPKEIYEKTIEFFKFIYRESPEYARRDRRIIGKDAYLYIAEKVGNKNLSDSSIGHLTHFALPLAAKRAIDYSDFFSKHNKNLSDIKQEQAQLFGHCQVYIIEGYSKKASDILEKLAEIEKEFEEELMKI